MAITKSVLTNVLVLNLEYKFEIAVYKKPAA